MTYDKFETYQLPMGWCWIDLPLRKEAHGFFLQEQDAACSAQGTIFLEEQAAIDAAEPKRDRRMLARNAGEKLRRQGTK